MSLILILKQPAIILEVLMDLFFLKKLVLVFAVILPILMGDPGYSVSLTAPSRLRVEYLENPGNIDIPDPRFSWIVTGEGRGIVQSAYQIIVASDPDKLNADAGDMWNSGKVLTDQSVNIVYDGNPFESGKTYYWKVKTWDGRDLPSPFSLPANFKMGLLRESDWQGKWIGINPPRMKIEKIARTQWWDMLEKGGGGLLRKEFVLRKPVAAARAYVSGLGYYELHLNGKKAGDLVLDPVRTNYDVRIFYSAFDVADFLVQGSNVAGIMLGQGWYLNSPRAILQLNIEYADGSRESVCTDGTWNSHSGPIVENTVYGGETYDARREESGWDTAGFDDSAWKPADLPGNPGGRLVAEMVTPIKVARTLRPVRLTRPQSGVWVYDFGQNLTGWIEIAVEGVKGIQVSIEYAENLYPEGTVNDENYRSAGVRDVYILKGYGREIYEPRFTYHGFRYVQITGYPGEPDLNSVRARVVHTAINEDWQSTFSCSNDLLNRIQRMIYWTQTGNVNGYPMDCPQRDERQGWAGDGHLTAEEAIYNFNMASLYSKWIDDIYTNQGADGFIPDTSPNETGKGMPNDDPAWDAYCILMPWYMYFYYGDTRLIVKHYDGMKKYLGHLMSKADDNILNFGMYGDWIAPESTPLPLINTGYFYYDTFILSKFAAILENREDEEKFSRIAAEIKSAFNREFFNEDKEEYRSGTSYSSVWPLYLGLVPGEHVAGVVNNLVNHIRNDWNGHISTGIQGTKYIFSVLCNYGFPEVAYEMAIKEEYPGWGYMVSHDATTVWELWEYRTGTRMNSHNHPALGSIGEWFYKHLAGIQMNPGNPGFKNIIIKPVIPGNLNYAKAVTESIRGVISSEWRRNGDILTLSIRIPSNCAATVYVPTLGNPECSITEGGDLLVVKGKAMENDSMITHTGSENGYIIFTLPSGSYEFTAKPASL